MKINKFRRFYAPVFIAGTTVFFLASAYRFVFKSDRAQAQDNTDSTVRPNEKLAKRPDALPQSTSTSTDYKSAE